MSISSVTENPPSSVFDATGLATIKRGLKTDDPKALKAAAQQFEALFLQMVLKSMRDATPHEELFDNEQSRMFESLLDQQLAQVMSSKRGVGLAQVIERQLLRNSATPGAEQGPMRLDSPAPAVPLRQNRSFVLPRDPVPQALPPADLPAVWPAPSPGRALDAVLRDGVPSLPRVSALPADAREFVARLRPEAEAAASETGIPAAFIIGHAALESGWGRSEPRTANGQPSYNLFGIKAGNNWTGKAVDASTVEYVQGVAQRRTERFRAYASYAEGFADYARLLADNSRYEGVLDASDSGTFARGLQTAGYATDPRYANKLERVIAMAEMSFTPL